MEAKTLEFKVHNYDVKHPNRLCKKLLKEAQVESLRTKGYIKLEHSLTKEQLARLRNSTEFLILKKYGATNTQTYSSSKFAGQYIRDPHKQDKYFLDLLMPNAPYAHILRSIMGPRIQIRSFSLRITHPKSGSGTMWHRDQRSFVSPLPVFHTTPHVFSLSFYLDGASENNGPLFLLPGSHLSAIEGEDSEYYGDYPEQEKLQLNEGEVVLFHSSIMHRGGENLSSKIRRLIIIHFTPVYFKQASYDNTEIGENYNETVSQCRLNKDEEMLELLGEEGLNGYKLFM